MNYFDLWLANCKINNKQKVNYYNKFNGCENLWYHVKNNEYSNDCDIKIFKLLKSCLDEEYFKKLYLYLIENGIKTVTIGEAIYPENLKSIDDAPFLLFYKGNLEKLNENVNVSIVGSRTPTFYGKEVANLISKELSTYNINIISGMARGIDGCSHSSCIKNNGYTCAVLGCGIDVIYPKNHMELYKSICETGCVISEYMPGTEPFPYNFPYRNRIISGLSKIVIVVEASYKSGSLITADLALNQGKEVMAVPGSIFSNMSKGTNQLIRDGAYVITSIDDILFLLNIDTENRCKNKSIKKILNAQEDCIIKCIGDSPIHIDDIIKLTNIDIKQLYELLFELQLKNEIICLAGNYYAKLQDKL